MYRARAVASAEYKIPGSILNDIGLIHEGSRYRMKDLEKARIFEVILKDPGTTRSLLGKTLSIRPTSVSHAVSELVADGLVREARETGEIRQGRPEIQLFAEKDRFVAISAYITSRTLRAAIVNAFEEVLSSVEVLIETNDTNGKLLEKLKNAVATLKSRFPKKSEFLGISLSVPGFMDTDKKMWIFTARWPSLRKLSFQDIEKATGSPLALSRVLDAGLEYIIAQDEELKKTDTLLVHWGYGIGAAYANAGKVLSSNIGGVCEIGHCKIQNENPKPCTCGSSGCLETVSSLRSLAPVLRAEYPDLPEEEGLFIDYVKNREEIASHPAVIEATTEMGRAIGTLFMTLFPKVILVYGALSSLPSVRKKLLVAIKDNTPQFARSFLSVRFLAEGVQSELFGSARPLFRNAFRRTLQAGSSDRRNI